MDTYKKYLKLFQTILKFLTLYALEQKVIWGAVNLLKSTLRVPVGRYGHEWYHWSCVVIGHITASKKLLICEVQNPTYSVTSLNFENALSERKVTKSDVIENVLSHLDIHIDVDISTPRLSEPEPSTGVTTSLRGRSRVPLLRLRLRQLRLRLRLRLLSELSELSF